VTGTSPPAPPSVADWSALAPAEETRALASTARDHFSSLRTRERARTAVPADEIGSDLWSAIAEAGYWQIGLPESLGGIGTPLDLVVLLEEAGRALVPAALSSTCAALQLVLQSGADGEQFGDLDHGHFAFGCGDADPRSAGLSVRGLSVLDGFGAAKIVVAVAGPGGTSYVVAADPHALACSEPDTTLDPSRPIVRVDVDDIGALPGLIVASKPLDVLAAPARMCVAADLLGVAAGALDAAVDHVQSRRQFGRPLGSFQAVKHQLADAYVEVEKTRSLVRGCALAVTRSPDDIETALLANLALASAIRSAVDTARRRVQLLGAMGVTNESDAHLYLRRAHQISKAVGPASSLYARAAEMQRSVDV
jgi:alkylation response protein AidB-like acyl-CoA dehydrogenase